MLVYPRFQIKLKLFTKYLYNSYFQRAVYLPHLQQCQLQPKKQPRDPLILQQPLPQNQQQDPLMSQQPQQPLPLQQPPRQNQLQDPHTLQNPQLKNLMYLQHLTMIMMT